MGRYLKIKNESKTGTIVIPVSFGLDFVQDGTMYTYLIGQLANYSLPYIEENNITVDDVAYQTNYLKQWVDIQAPYWNKLYETTKYEYNPIHNYDMNECECGMGETLAENTDNNQARNFQDNQGWRNGYNSTVDVPTNHDINNGNTNVDNYGKTDTKQKNKRAMHRAGNIGVKSSQALILEERNIILNLIEKYIDEFKKNLVLETEYNFYV